MGMRYFSGMINKNFDTPIFGGEATYFWRPCFGKLKKKVLRLNRSGGCTTL